MAKSIRFTVVNSGGPLVATAQVELFRGVYLAGWCVFREGDRVWVWPPYREVVETPAGGRRFVSYLRFDDQKTFQRWADRIRDEYVKWAKTQED